MILSEKIKKDIEQRFEKVKVQCQNRAKELFAVFTECNDDEAICLKYLYAYMPSQDLANYDGSLFLNFSRHALKMRKIVPWGENIADALFLNYVLQYRINNENIEFYSEIISNELLNIIKGKSMKDAVIAINYWCFSKATYQTTDQRTASPLTVIRNAYGRCGEESTFTVASLRSVGIPARQIYAPRWAHCEDNHAWVEVYIDGQWHSIGACEPEDVLDSAWFISHASKAMLLNTKVLAHTLDNTEVVLKTDLYSEVNVLAHYAKTKRLTVIVQDEQGRMVEDAHVRFEIVNYSELFPLADIKTDKNGKVDILTGFGDMIVFVHKDDIHTFKKVDMRKEDLVTITLPKESVDIISFELIPPQGIAPAQTNQKADKSEYNKALAIRKEFETTFYTGKKAIAFAETYGAHKDKIANFLENARGNYKEIIDFIHDDDTKNFLDDKIAMLGTLTKKDFSDITCDILKTHFIHAMQFKNTVREDIFVPHLLSPRIMHEMITDYRKTLAHYFSADKIVLFTQNPKEILNYIPIQYTDGQMTHTPSYYSNPVGLLTLGIGDSVSQKIAFVAICRSLGIPAKFNKEDFSLSYYQNDAWVDIKDVSSAEAKKGTLILKVLDDTKLEYMKNFTIAKLSGAYHTLNFREKIELINISLEEGFYRVMISDRNDDGNVIATMYYAKIKENETLTLAVTAKKHDIIAKYMVDIKNHIVYNREESEKDLFDIISNKNSMLAYIDVSKEPTEHLLNEIFDEQDKFNKIDANLVLILKNKKDLNDKTLQKMLKVVDKIQVYIGYNEEFIQYIYKDIPLLDKSLPLVCVTNNNRKIINAWAGYNVGMGEMVLKYINAKEKVIENE